MPKKSCEKRQEEIQTIRDKLQSLGLSCENKDIALFEKYLSEFEKGFSSSGEIRLEGLKRRLQYKLSCQNHIASSVLLKYDETV